MNIHQATINDVPLLLSFIKELADYEKSLHEVVATEEILKKTLFGEHPRAEVVIGYLNQKRTRSVSGTGLRKTYEIKIDCHAVGRAGNH